MIASGFAASAAPRHEPPLERGREEQRGREQRERGEQHEQPVVVERGGKQPPRGGGQHGAREVREVVESDLPPAAFPCRRVPAFEPGVPVVVTVRVVAVENEVAGDVDLVGGVVHVVPGGGGVAEPDLQQDRGDDEQRDDDGTERDRPAAAPAIRTPGDGARERDDERGDHGGRPRNVGIPLLVGSADERSEHAAGFDVGGSERPCARPQVGQGDDREHAEGPEDRPDGRARDRHQVRAGSGDGAIVATSSAGWSRERR